MSKQRAVPVEPFRAVPVVPALSPPELFPNVSEGTVLTRSRKKPERLNPHVIEHIERSRRAASIEACPRCSAPVLVGPDHDRVAVRRVLDVEPVDALTEAVALLRGGSSADVCLSGGKRVIWHREPHHYLNPVRPYPVHLDHVCPEVES